MPAERPSPPGAKQYRAAILFAFAVGIVLYVAYRLHDVLLLIYVSALFAVVIFPAIRLVRKVHLGKWHPGRGMAFLIILLAGLTLISAFLVFALPPIYRDVQGLAADWPHHAEQIRARLQAIPFAQHVDMDVIQQHLAATLGGILGLFTTVAGGFFGFFTFLLLTAYFIIDGERAFYWGVSLFPPAQGQRLQQTMLRADARMRGWLVGQSALMLILGTSSAIVYGSLGVKYFYALAVFAGLANFVPIVGPVVSLILASLVAASQSWEKFLGVLIFYIAYQQVENAILTPRIMKSTVDLPALTVIIALIIGGALEGVLGALIAVPSAALASTLVDEYFVQHRAAQRVEVT